MSRGVSRSTSIIVMLLMLSVAACAQWHEDWPLAETQTIKLVYFTNLTEALWERQDAVGVDRSDFVTSVITQQMTNVVETTTHESGRTVTWTNTSINLYTNSATNVFANFPLDSFMTNLWDGIGACMTDDGGSFFGPWWSTDGGTNYTNNIYEYVWRTNGPYFQGPLYEDHFADDDFITWDGAVQSAPFGETTYIPDVGEYFEQNRTNLFDYGLDAGRNETNAYGHISEGLTYFHRYTYSPSNSHTYLLATAYAHSNATLGLRWASHPTNSYIDAPTNWFMYYGSPGSLELDYQYVGDAAPQIIYTSGTTNALAAFTNEIAFRGEVVTALLPSPIGITQTNWTNPRLELFTYRLWRTQEISNATSDALSVTNTFANTNTFNSVTSITNVVGTPQNFGVNSNDFIGADQIVIQYHVTNGYTRGLLDDSDDPDFTLGSHDEVVSVAQFNTVYRMIDIMRYIMLRMYGDTNSVGWQMEPASISGEKKSVVSGWHSTLAAAKSEAISLFNSASAGNGVVREAHTFSDVEHQVHASTNRYRAALQVQLDKTQISGPDSATNYTFDITPYYSAEPFFYTGGPLEYTMDPWTSVFLTNCLNVVESAVVAGSSDVNHLLLIPTNGFSPPDFSSSTPSSERIRRGWQSEIFFPFRTFVIDFTAHSNGFQYVSDTVYTNIFEVP
jgi:hypothetical protein